MSFSPSFADILNAVSESQYEAQSATPSNAGSDYTAGWESHHEPSGLAQLLGEISVSRTHVLYNRDSRAQKAYPRPQRPLRPQSTQRSPHSFTAEQQQAYSHLTGYVATLPNNFDRSDLKSAYRRAVLLTHPDRGGSSESFHQVKKSYQILSSLVTNEA